jgi:hypothetical protein
MDCLDNGADEMIKYSFRNASIDGGKRSLWVLVVSKRLAAAASTTGRR